MLLNGGGGGSNGLTNGHSDSVAVQEMCVFCFDVLYGELYNLDPPRDPKFTNDA